MRKLSLALSLWLLSSVAALAAAPPSWPTLKQQLSQDRVVPGSALEKVIRANQDFRLLRRDEAKDDRGLPLWIRVLWRKAHPELEYSADDPTGGYPLVLKEIHEWMLAHQDLIPGPPEKMVLPQPNRTVVGTNLRISGAQTAPRSESDIRIDYWNPQRIISASNNIVASGRQGQYWSSDGGATWGQTILSLVTGDAFHSDPTVDWDSNGDAWSTTLGINSSATVLRLRTYKSTDGGQTWTYDSLASGTQASVDKQMVWVDHSATSPYADTIYAIWHNGLPAFMNRKLPGGNWDTPIQVSGTETTGTAIGSDVKTNAYGDVFGFWPATGNRRLLVTKSTDGGASYSAPVIIGTTFDSFEIAVPSFAQRKAFIYISGGAYRTATKDMVYASWVDLSGEAGCTLGSQAPGTNVLSTCKSRIWFSRSADGGATWSAPVKINNQPGLNDQFNQWMVVDETNGALGIIYYDTVDDPGRKKTDVWYQASFDDGATWAPAVKVTTAMTDETVAGANLGNQYGDYNGLSGYARVLFPSWTDRRNNAREEIWTAHIDEPETDVWTKDKPWDTGAEPDGATAGNNMWESEDIWVRNDLTPGPHQNPEHGQTNYIHVMVRNRSNVEAINVPVHVYVAFANGGLSWDVDWTFVGTAYVNSLLPNASTDVVVPWNPSGTGHFCLLSRLVTAQDPMTNPETTDVNYNTRYNNNIAWKNVNVVDLTRNVVVPVKVRIRNTELATRKLNLVFRESKRTADHSFFQRGLVTIVLGDELAKRWAESGQEGDGIERIDDRTVRIADPGRAALAVELKSREEHEIVIEFRDTAPNPTAERRPIRYALELVQEDPDKKEPQGGVTYEIEALPPR
jgi:hypothetical protein